MLGLKLINVSERGPRRVTQAVAPWFCSASLLSVKSLILALKLKRSSHDNFVLKKNISERYHEAIYVGVRVIKPISLVPLWITRHRFNETSIFNVPPRLTHSYTYQILSWFKLYNRHFCCFRNIPREIPREINERGFGILKFRASFRNRD